MVSRGEGGLALAFSKGWLYAAGKLTPHHSTPTTRHPLSMIAKCTIEAVINKDIYEYMWKAKGSNKRQAGGRKQDV